RGVNAVVTDVRSVSAVLDHNPPALVGVFAQNPAGVGTKTAALLRIGLFFGDQRDSAVEADGQNIIAFFQICICLAVLHIRAEPSNAGNDGLAVVGPQADFAW